MTYKFSQKHPFKGSQEFEIIGDVINLRLKKPFKDERIKTVMLAMIDPKPVINKSILEFHSRVPCNPLLALFINKPNKQEFDAFVAKVIAQATHEYNDFTGLKN